MLLSANRFAGTMGNGSMHIICRKGWELPERLATPESVFLNRRAFLNGAASVAAALAVPQAAQAQRIADLPDPTRDLYPAPDNPAFQVDLPITDEAINNSYNNFYEFGSSKNIGRAAQALKLRPWMIRIDGMVEKPIDIGIDELIRKMTLEQRVYRHRCVEAWSMVTDHPKLARRVAECRAGRNRRRLPSLPHDDCGQRRARRILDHCRRRAKLTRPGEIVVTIAHRATHCDEQRTGRDVPAVVGDHLEGIGEIPGNAFEQTRALQCTSDLVQWKAHHGIC
jgi:hypothetical protein